MLEKGITRRVTLSILPVLALVRAQVGSGTDVGRKNQHEPDPTGLRPTQHEVKNVPPQSTSNQSAKNRYGKGSTKRWALPAFCEHTFSGNSVFNLR